MIQIDLSSSGFFAEKISVPEVYRLTAAVYGWVSVDAYQRGTKLSECPDGKGRYRLYHRDKRIGRGFDLQFTGPKTVRAELDFPAVHDDTESFGEVIQIICDRYKIKQLTDGSGKKQSLEEVLTLLEHLKQKEESNFESYKSFLCSGSSGRKKTAVITLVSNPLYISIQAVSRMNASEFRNMLNEKQQNDYYMIPMYFQKPGEAGILMAYALTEGVVSIIPKQVFFPAYQPLAADAEIPEDKIIVNLVATADGTGEVIGSVPAVRLFEQLHDYVIADYDEKCHVIRGLTEAEMRSFL